MAFMLAHTHPFNGPLSRTTRVSQYQKGIPIWILLKQETVSGSGINWAICKSAPRSRQVTTPAPHQSVFYRPDARPATQPTVSKHWRQNIHADILFKKGIFSKPHGPIGQQWFSILEPLATAMGLMHHAVCLFLQGCIDNWYLSCLSSP